MNENRELQPTPNPINPATEASNSMAAAFGVQQQTAYIGVVKRYKINSKWSGTFLASYNFLWQQEGMRSPWLLRFEWEK